MGFGSSAAAGAGADALRQVLQQHFEQTLRNQQLKQEQDRLDLDRQRIADSQQLATENARYLNEQRAAAAAKLQEETDAASAKRDAMTTFMADPSVPEATRQWMRGAALGWNQLTPHDYEAPTVHQTHLDADAKRKADDAFAQHRRFRDYDNAHPAPVRVQGAKVVSDDPTLPLGAQRYITQIATKHAGDLAGARVELDAYLNSPETAAAHPHLSPIKAHDALRRIAGAGGGSTDPLDQLIGEAIAGSAIGGGRGVGSGAVRIAGVRSAGASGGGDAALQERARQVLQQNGYATTPENIQRFLSDPANRRALSGGQ